MKERLLLQLYQIKPVATRNTHISYSSCLPNCFVIDLSLFLVHRLDSLFANAYFHPDHTVRQEKQFTEVFTPPYTLSVFVLLLINMTQHVLCNINISRKKVDVCLKFRLFKRNTHAHAHAHADLVNLMYYSQHLDPLKQHKAKPIWSESQRMISERYSSLIPYNREINESRDYFHF